MFNGYCILFIIPYMRHPCTCRGGLWFVARGSCEFPQFLVVGARTWQPLQNRVGGISE